MTHTTHLTLISPKQMAELYFSKLKLVGRGTSTDATNRELMRKHPRTSPAARAVLNAVDNYIEDSKFYLGIRKRKA